MKTRWLIAIAALAFAWSALARAPAAVVYGWLAGRLHSVQLFGLDGTLARGSAAAVSINGRTPLRNLEWRLQPLWLLALHAGFEVRSGAPVAASDHVRLSPLGAVAARDLDVDADLKPLLVALNYGFLPVAGRARLQIAKLDLGGGRIRRAEGTLQVRQLAWTLGRAPVMLGDFEAVAKPENNGQAAAIRSTAGPLDASGEARLAADGGYEVHLRLKPKPGADPQVVNLLHGLGAPDTQGYYQLRSRGKP